MPGSRTTTLDLNVPQQPHLCASPVGQVTPNQASSFLRWDLENFHINGITPAMVKCTHTHIHAPRKASIAKHSICRKLLESTSGNSTPPPKSWFGDIFLLLHRTYRTSENLCHHPAVRVGIMYREMSLMNPTVSTFGNYS